MRRPAKKIFIHGFIITVTLAIIQLLLIFYQNQFLLYIPPIGFGFFLLVSYLIQPLIVGVINVVILQRFYDLRDWRIGFWLNGLFLLLVFSSINLLLQTTLNVIFSPIIAIAEILILSYPFGYLGRFSNRERQTKTENNEVQQKA